MYQPQNYHYHHNLGVAGHRASNYSQSHRPFYSYNRPYYPQPPYPVQKAHHPQQNQPVNGGISSVLQYDLNNMSSFLSWCAFGMLKQTRNPTPDFENLVVSVLFATRLPSSTVIIALEYMNQRFSSNDKITSQTLTEQEIFIHLVVALVLANKFNDDNTFTNKSWCGATGLDLALLNKHEMTWLEECKWSLNVVNYEANILTLEQCWKTWLDKYDRSMPAQEPYHEPEAAPSPCSYTYASSPIQPSYYPQHHNIRPAYYNSIPSSPIHRGYLSSSPQTASSPISDNGFWWNGVPRSSANIWNYPASSYYPSYSNEPVSYMPDTYYPPVPLNNYAPMPPHHYSFNPAPYYGSTTC